MQTSTFVLVKPKHGTRQVQGIGLDLLELRIWFSIILNDSKFF